MAIGGYFVNGYWWLLMVIVLMAIGGYFINGYWWIFKKRLGTHEFESFQLGQFKGFIVRKWFN
jgi:hypothetical protein